MLSPASTSASAVLGVVIDYVMTLAQRMALALFIKISNWTMDLKNGLNRGGQS